MALDPEDLCRLSAVTETLLAAEVPFRLMPSLFEHGYRAAKLSGFDELPLVDIGVDPLDQAQRVFKRAGDVVAAAVALTVMSPVLLAVALAGKLTSPGPVLFRQERVGRNGRHFQMLKFRTMVQDAEEHLAELAGHNEAEGHLFKMQDDPRVTPGITGLWQVSGRSGLSFDDMVRLDRLYIENWSLSLDLSILLKTVRVVLGRRGAW